MKVLDLFSGIGGFALGLERAGMVTVAFCEISPFCRKVLAKNFPGKPIYDDVRTLTATRLDSDGLLPIDIVCGGFPCTDISLAGKRAGITGRNSGLWSEFARLIGEIRPRYVLVENVAALRSRGLDRVLGDLAALGYDADWNCIPASAVGAPHKRDRIWIIAYPHGQRFAQRSQCNSQPLAGEQAPSGHDPVRLRDDVADADRPRLPQRGESQLLVQCSALERSGWWAAEPDVGRVAHGVPARVDRLRGLGNSLVPQIAEILGRTICRSS